MRPVISGHDDGAMGGGPGGAAPFGHFAPTAAQRVLVGLAGVSPLGRGRTRWWVSRMLERLRPGPIDTERFGLKLRLHHYGDNYSEKKLLLHPRHYDERELAHIVRDAPPQFCFADVGAHTGLYSYVVKSRCPDARIAAFEPSPTYCRRIEFNARANDLPDFHVIEAAVGAERGRARLYINQGALSGEGPSLDVAVVPLDAALQEHGFERLDALKIDVEGFEDRVLFPFFEAAPPALRPKVIVIEHALQSQWRRDCLALLRAQGYRESWRGALNAVYERAN